MEQKNDGLLPCQKETALENIESSMNLYDMPEYQDTLAVEGWALSELVDEVKRWRATHSAGEFSPDYCAASEALAEHLEHCSRAKKAESAECETCPYENYGPCPGCVHPDNTPSPVAVDGGAWRKEAEKTLDHLSAFLQRIGAPHRVHWREWIDQAGLLFDELKAATPPTAAQISGMVGEDALFKIVADTFIDEDSYRAGIIRETISEIALQYPNGIKIVKDKA